MVRLIEGAVSRPRYRVENRDQEIAPTDIGYRDFVVS